MTPNAKYTSPLNPMMLTQTRAIDPLDPTSWSPIIGELVLSLPNINRYNGHTLFPYSVAQHSLICAEIGRSAYALTKPHQQLALLLHDGAEAYLQDIIRPLKQFSTDDYLDSEEVITQKIWESLPLRHSEMEDILSSPFNEFLKEIDTRLAVTEVLQLLPKHHDPIPPYKPYDYRIIERTHHEVRTSFVSQIEENIKLLGGLNEQRETA